MCGANVGTAMQVLGVGAGIAGSRMQSKAAEQAAAYSAAVAANNAKIAEWQAQDVEQRGELAKEDLGRNISRLKGTGRAAYAAGNVQIGSGSALSWEQDVAEESTLEELKIDHNTEMEAWGIRNQDTGQNQANMMSAQAKATRSAGNIGTIGSLLSLGSQFASSNTFGKAKTPTKQKEWSTKGADAAAEKAAQFAAKATAGRVRK